MGKRTNRIFEVTLPGYETTYVETDNCADAVSFVKNNIDQLVTNEENRRFSCKEQPNTVKPYMNRIFTDDGMKWFDEYITELEEQETKNKEYATRIKEEKNKRNNAITTLIKYIKAKGTLVNCDYSFKHEYGGIEKPDRLTAISIKSGQGYRLGLRFENPSTGMPFWFNADKAPSFLLEKIIMYLQGLIISDDTLTYKELMGKTDNFIITWSKYKTRETLNKEIMQYAKENDIKELQKQTAVDIERDKVELCNYIGYFVTDLEKRYSMVGFNWKCLQESILSDPKKLHEFVEDMEIRLNKKRSEMKTDWDNTMKTT